MGRIRSLRLLPADRLPVVFAIRRGIVAASVSGGSLLAGCKGVCCIFSCSLSLLFSSPASGYCGACRDKGRWQFCREFIIFQIFLSFFLWMTLFLVRFAFRLRICRNASSGEISPDALRWSPIVNMKMQGGRLNRGDWITATQGFKKISRNRLVYRLVSRRVHFRDGAFGRERSEPDCRRRHAPERPPEKAHVIRTQPVRN